MIIVLQTLLSDLGALGGIALVIAFGVAALMVVRAQLQRAKEALGLFGTGLSARLRVWPAELDDDASEGLWPALRSQLLFRKPDGTFVIRISADAALEKKAVELLRRGTGGVYLRYVGENLTALALVLTFSLLGYVLLGPIAEALRLAGTEQSEALRGAVAKMGAKFFVSAAGLVLSVWVHASLKSAEAELRILLHEVTVPFSARLEELVVSQARSAASTLDAVAPIRADLLRLGGGLTDQLRQLENIKVSVHGIGEEVATHIGRLMTQNVADRICDAVVALQVHASDVALKMQDRLASSFASALQGEVAHLQQGLEGVKAAVEGQAQADMELLLTKLSETVSGGFSNESSNMASQLARFGEVLPRLQSQFEQMSVVMQENARQNGEANQRANDALNAKIVDLLTRFETAQKGMSSAVAQVASAGVETAQQLSDATAGQIQELARQFGSTRVEMDAMVQRMTQLTTDVASSVRSSAEEHAHSVAGQLSAIRTTASVSAQQMNEYSAAFAQAVGNAQVGMVALSQGLTSAHTELVGTLQITRQVQQGANEAQVRLAANLKQIGESFDRLERTLARQGESIKNEEVLLQAQRKVVDSLEPVLGGIMKGYQSAIESQSKLLASEWETLAKKTQAVVSGAAGELGEFGESVEELGKTVRELKNVMVQRGTKA